MADLLNKLNSANYVTVKVIDNAIVNGNNLLAAYTLAKTRLPNGAALSTSNRLAVILPVAKYDLGAQSLILDTEYVDIVGSTSDRSKHYITSNIGASNRGTVQQTANNVKLYNLTIENNNTTHSRLNNSTDPSAYFPNTNLNLTYVENILFTSNLSYTFSMRIGIPYNGTFINCTGGDYSFGGGIAVGGTAGGIFTGCIGGNYSFGGYGGIASGEFKDCIGGYESFGSGGSTGEVGSGGTGTGVASGIFTNCTGGFGSFGWLGTTANGVFNHCIGEDVSFGAHGIANGTFKDCTGGHGSFGGDNGTANGTYTNCTGGDYSFGGGGAGEGIASGTFKDCSGGNYSFGGNFGTTSGDFTNCIGGIGSFNL